MSIQPPPKERDSLGKDDYEFVSFADLPSSGEPHEAKKKTNFVAEATFCDKCNLTKLKPSTAFELFNLESARDGSKKSLGCWLVYPKKSSIWNALWRPFTDYYPLEDGWTFTVSFNKQGKPILTKKKPHRCSSSY
jgi:hypothetical protein